VEKRVSRGIVEGCKSSAIVTLPAWQAPALAMQTHTTWGTRRILAAMKARGNTAAIFSCESWVAEAQCILADTMSRAEIGASGQLRASGALIAWMAKALCSSALAMMRAVLWTGLLNIAVLSREPRGTVTRSMCTHSTPVAEGGACQCASTIITSIARVTNALTKSAQAVCGAI